MCLFVAVVSKCLFVLGLLAAVCSRITSRMLGLLLHVVCVLGLLVAVCARITCALTRITSAFCFCALGKAERQKGRTKANRSNK